MPVLLIAGYGPGISDATARLFGSRGYAVALLGRNRQRLDEGVARLRELGIEAGAYPADASESGSLRAVVSDVRSDLGPVSAILWTAFRHGDVGDVLESDPERISTVFQVGVTGLLTTVQACLDDLRAAPGSAVLIANGAVGEPSTEADRFAVTLGIDGTALENAAKSKLAGILAERLRGDDVYVGEITIAGSVAGTETASPTAIDPAEVAERLWTLSQQRAPTRDRIVERGA